MTMHFLKHLLRDAPERADYIELSLFEYICKNNITSPESFVDKFIIIWHFYDPNMELVNPDDWNKFIKKIKKTANHGFALQAELTIRNRACFLIKKYNAFTIRPRQDNEDKQEDILEFLKTKPEWFQEFQDFKPRLALTPYGYLIGEFETYEKKLNTKNASKIFFAIAKDVCPNRFKINL